MSDPRLCFGCATAFDLNAAASCPACRTDHDENRYRRVEGIAHDVVYHGHLYRRKYEENFAAGNTRVRYHLVEPHAALVWLGITVLSGILGGASWDVVRAAASRIKKSSVTAGTATPDLEILRSDVEEYVNGMPNVSPAIRSAILEEIIAHAAGPYITKAVTQALENPDSIPKNYSALVADAIAKTTKEALKRQRSLRSSEAEFEKLWSRLQAAVAEADRI